MRGHVTHCFDVEDRDRWIESRTIDLTAATVVMSAIRDESSRRAHPCTASPASMFHKTGTTCGM